MSYRSDNHASYDHTLLSSVPDPTRAEKQEGYNVGLLEESRDRRAPSPSANGAAPEQNGAAALDYSPGAVSYARKEEPTATNEYEAVDKRVPWYRTRKGMIGIVVVALIIIIAAAVGGGVGGSHHSHSSKNNANGSNEVGQSSNNTQGLGQGANSTSTTPTSTTPSSSATVGGLSQGLAPSISPSPGLNNVRRVA
ncbi:hypothetical protein V8E53_000408 [Lactarius tabidus]